MPNYRQMYEYSLRAMLYALESLTNRQVDAAIQALQDSQRRTEEWYITEEGTEKVFYLNAPNYKRLYHDCFNAITDALDAILEHRKAKEAAHILERAYAKLQPEEPTTPQPEDQAAHKH